MNRAKLLELKKSVERELSRAKNAMLKATSDAQEVAKSASSSPSQSGDRFHEEGHAVITRKRYLQMKELYDEIVKAERLPIPEKIIVPSFVEIKYGHDVEEFHIVDNVAIVPGIKLVSSKSELAKVILHKKIGEKISISDKDGIIANVG